MFLKFCLLISIVHFILCNSCSKHFFCQMAAKSAYEDEEQGARGTRSPGESGVDEEIGVPDEDCTNFPLRMGTNAAADKNWGVLLRGAGQRVTFDPEAPPLPPQTAKKINEKVKRHSIHGMIEEENVVRPHQEMASLSYDEKKYLLAVERGDIASVRRMLQGAHKTEMNINCVDPLGRSALLMAIDNENLEMVELLIHHKVDTKDALLHAISEEFVEAVEVLLDHEDKFHRNGEPHVSRFQHVIYSWEALPSDTATFTPDITPLILAAHRDNYEIIKILLDRSFMLPMPHDVRCGCDDCVTSRREDSLRHSRSRINAYRALASPSLISLSSKDPILTAFELSWELRRLSFLEHEFKCEYQELRRQCQDFATALLDHTRTSYELEVLLNHDPTGPAFEHGERMHLNRLKLAIKFRQKKFVAHPNVQQLLASIWYEGLPGFRRKNMVLQALEIVRIGVLFPFFSVAYIIAPHSVVGQTMRKPFIKFICHSASYFTFLFMLILASQRIESVIGNWMGHDVVEHEPAPTKRGAAPTIVEWFILAWVSGLIWSEVKQLWDVGLEEYVNDMWNVIDFVTNSLYVATAALRVVAYYRVQKETESQEPGSVIELQREQWDTWDPMLISEGLFSAANIFSSLKLVYIFSVNPHLGPLQVSLSRMVMDIMKFFFLYVLVLFAFSCGLNQLLWYYADMEKKRCPTAVTYSPNASVTADSNACIVWRRFANLFETAQTLFWAVFGLVDLESFELDGIKAFTRFWGMLMFGTYSVINIVVLLNLLIAMMNHSYQLISERADIEWKFARSKLWISYFEEGGTVPPPFNIIPTPKSMWYMGQWMYRKFCGHSRAAKREHMRTIKRKVKAEERDIRYQRIMRNLVRRYVTVEQRKAENEGVTEDDVNEIKQDISALRCELIEILKNSGMNTSTASGTGTDGSLKELSIGAGGKKNRQKERRLMKGFNIAPQPGGSGSLPPVDEFTASLQQVQEENSHELFGSTLSGIFGQGTIHKKSHHHTSTNSVPGLSSCRQSRRIRGSSKKKRWENLIEAAKVRGRVSKFIVRSPSVDSVYSPASEDGGSRSEGSTDSKSSLETPGHEVQSSHHPDHSHHHEGHQMLSHGLSALVALHRKRKTFSDSRSSTSGMRSSSGTNPIHPITSALMSKVSKKQQLQRASSVPTRGPEQGPQPIAPRLHEGTQSQQPSIDTPEGASANEQPVVPAAPLTPSTTEESVVASSSLPATMKRNGSATQLQRLPGIEPISGHDVSGGWL
ncbi:Transient receptor potential-gamma protein [Anthophora quadrimaculata]